MNCGWGFGGGGGETNWGGGGRSTQEMIAEVLRTEQMEK